MLPCLLLPLLAPVAAGIGSKPQVSEPAVVQVASLDSALHDAQRPFRAGWTNAPIPLDGLTVALAPHRNEPLIGLQHSDALLEFGFANAVLTDGEAPLFSPCFSVDLGRLLGGS